LVCASPPTSSAQSKTRQRLLLVEDDVSTASVYARLFRAQGFEVFYASTIADAKAHLTRDVDWVVLDLMLPDGSGLQVMRLLQEMRLPARVAVITGASDPDSLWEVTRLHPQALLRKPVDPRELLRVVDQG